jgi:hypothetical protein
MHFIACRRTALIGLLALGVGIGSAVAVAPAGAATSPPAVADTTITLATSNANVKYGSAGKITATVKVVAPGQGVVTGTVDFSVDGGYFWTSTVDTNGKATLAMADLLPSLYPGTYAITATYSGDANFNGSTTATALSQTVVGIATEPTTTLTLNARGVPVFTPRSFTLSSASPVGCNVTIVNNTPTAQVLVYGTPGAWKRLPNGGIAAGGARGIGVGMANYTGYFSTMANTNNYVAIHCR